ncbi:Sap190p NDAI_0B05060 [Naumovozyma dairenensis CBS 421]|uniref:Uncharacterized protein n=1 Tax=Naumovozyma dairenensis (strain ATCC 10597 / BCRC 20456 / CBS 421 / NBRC 0211 / NRRL Y-12639) TaxID=1071378 RepID=G0W6X8_NAUDC|nr:hypothetical protein NDAI_0B05060 [Naumovozyma dairenensis CBS 421]CCD23539.1 hypothetical protein NDAI_0B05060 [Naumovozyma dairenensis CBS 421]
MSGSFWKFGQDYSIESPISKLLNKAFIKIQPNDTNVNSFDNNTELQSEKDSGVTENAKEVSHDNEQEEPLPTDEAEYINYKPNLNILNELLDDEELYTELMCSNFKLLIYLKYPEVLTKLVEYVTSETILKEPVEPTTEAEIAEELIESAIVVDPSESEGEDTERENDPFLKVSRQSTQDDASSDISAETSVTVPPESEEQIDTRRARVAAEVLSADVWSLSSAIIENQSLLSKLWSIMDHEAPLSVAASTYFMKINERLLDMDITGMLQCILNLDTLVDRFLTHVDNPSLMDFLLKVISTDKPEAPTGVLNQLKEQDLIPKLLDRLDTNYSVATQSAAGDFLKAFVTLSANSNNELASGIGPNELTRQLVSPKMMEKLIQIMLKGGTSLSNGVGIIIELIRKNNSDYDFVQVIYTTLQSHPPNDRDPIHLIHMIKLFAKYMPQFNEMLIKRKLPQLETAFGEIEPLGFERFKICELVAELLHCSNMTLLNELEGEAIVKERDDERELQIRANDNNNVVVATDDEINTNGKEVTGKLNNLELSNGEPEKETEEEENAGEQAEDADDSKMGDANEDIENAEIYNETLSDSEETERSLRENSVPGDQLKIALQDTEIIKTILNMFFQFEWNNFLHNVVFDIVQQIFNGPLKTGYNRFLLTDLLTKTKITHMVIEGNRRCEEQTRKTGLRTGYMGHLVLIAEEIAKFIEYIDEMKVSFTNPAVVASFNEPSWINYVDTILTDTREKYNTVLGDFVNEQEENNTLLQDSLPEDPIDNNMEEDEANDESTNHINSGNIDLYYNYDYDNDNDSQHDDEDSADIDDEERMSSDGSLEYHDASSSPLSDSHVLEDDDLKDKSQEILEEDDKFSKYMSHHLGKGFTDTYDVIGTNSQGLTEEDWNSHGTKKNMTGIQHEKGSKENSAYMDSTIPSNDFTARTKHYSEPELQDDESSDDSSPELDDEDDMIIDDEDDDTGEYSLCRTRSKENIYMS